MARSLEVFQVNAIGQQCVDDYEIEVDGMHVIIGDNVKADDNWL